MKYIAFTDPSGGKSDSFTLAISHIEEDKVILDRAEEVRPPFNPKDVVRDFCQILKEYGIAEVIGDRYAGNWVSSSFKEYDINYIESELVKSDIFLEFQAIALSQRVTLLDIERLKNQLLSLERKTRPGGRGVVEHPPGLHDDLANSVAGTVVFCWKARSQVATEKELEARMPVRTTYEPAVSYQSRLKAAEEIMDRFMRESGCRKIDPEERGVLIE